MTPLALALLLSVPRLVPQLSGPVVDEAGLLQDADRAGLETLAQDARATHGGKGPQLQYLIVPALDGEPLEDFSIRVAEAWKLGTKGKDNGLLFVVAMAEHEFRLEVGGGLEGEVTDIQAKEILDGTLTPAFRAGEYGRGLRWAGIQALALASGSSPPVYHPFRPPPSSINFASVFAALFLLSLLVIGLWFMSQILKYDPDDGSRSSGSSGSWGSSSSGWGSSSSSSSSGSSWSGGGGSFSGGGASGSW